MVLTGLLIQLIAGTPRTDDAADKAREKKRHLTFLRVVLPTKDQYCPSTFSPAPVPQHRA